jgi:WD repeat-containing protein 19
VNKVVNIYDRHGEHQNDVMILLPGLCTSLDWDRDGDVLAVTHDKNGTLHLWSTHSSEVIKLDSGMKEHLTVCAWATTSNQLAVGTAKGNLLLYNHRSRRKIPILGKHSKAITTAAWSSENLLALGSADRSMTISNSRGDTLKSTQLRAEPYDIQFSTVTAEDGITSATIITIVIANKTLMLNEIDSEENPIELAFQGRYGNIVSYRPYGNGCIMIGFSNGYFVVISTRKDEHGQELFSSRNHKDCLSDVAISTSLSQAASCGDSCIKIHDLSDLKGVYTIIDIEEEKGQLDKLSWTDDGQLLSVSTVNGGVLTYLAKLPQLGDSSSTRVAYLTSLLQVTIVNNVEEEPAIKMDVVVEPSFMALGPFHMAVGINDRCWIYEIRDHGEVFEKSYLGNVTCMDLNRQYAAALYDGHIHLHTIDSTSEGTYPTSVDGGMGGRERESRIFPEQGKEELILSMGLTQDFLIYSTQNGCLKHFFLEDWQYVNEHRHVVGIAKVWPDPSGTRVVFVDEKSDAFLLNPVDDSVLELAHFPPNVRGILWETWSLDKHIFLAYDEESMFTYVHCRDTVTGPACQMVGATKLPFGLTPLMMHNGEVTCQSLTGKLAILRLGTHNFRDDQDMAEEQLRVSLQKSISLRRFKDAWSYAQALEVASCWEELAQAALYHLDIELAIRAYRHLKNVAMVYSLEQVQHVEDRNLLVGHLAMFMDQYNEAQDHFLASSNPMAALEMRRDLLHWDQALSLAKRLAPDQIPYISKEYAQQLEFTGDYANALFHYEKGILESPEDSAHNEVCSCGVARMAIRTGDIRRGIGMAQSRDNRQLKRDCAAILESMKLYAEAGVLYDRAESWDKAATVYVKSKNWDKVGELLRKVSSSRLHAQYAKAREADGHYMEAARAYESAHDHDNAARVYLDLLKSPDEAVRIVRESGSVEGAKMVARFFQKTGDYSSALQFLVLSKCNDEAFAMAESYDHMQLYAEVVGEDSTTEDYLRIATHFQRVSDHLRAGQFFLKAREFTKALEHFIQCSLSQYPEGEHIDLAIQTAAEAGDEAPVQRLTDYLIGEIDTVPKDARYLFQMYMALGQYPEAARTAILIAREDQTAGNYRNAHDVLFNMYTELRDREIRIPAEMVQNLMLLHSYILVKLHVKQGNHMKAARLLIRVANNISKFPSHVVPILTSTVIECQRAGLKGSAFGFAAMLMRPEYRQQIDVKWKKKIEQIVRKPDKTELEEEVRGCLHCSHPLPLTSLDCPQCKNTLHYCIVTGQHMVKDNWTECPHCKFPALLTEFQSLLESEKGDGVCPMCALPVKSSDLVLISKEN